MSRSRLLGVGLAIVGSLASARNVDAAACCGGGFGLGNRLAQDERGAVGIALRAQDLRGRWDANGRWVASPSDTLDRELRLEVDGLYKVGEQLQLGAVVPLLATWRRAADLSGRGGGLGDVSLLSRWDFVPPGGDGRWPGIAATFALAAPTGRSSERARDLLQSDATGLGTWEARPGVAIEQAWPSGLFFVLSGSVGFRAPYTRDDGVRLALSPRASLVSAIGQSWHRGLSISLGVLHEREAAPAIDSVRAADASRARTAAFLLVAETIAEQWTPFATIQTDLPLGTVGRNEPTVTSVTLGIRRAWNVYP